MGTGSEFNPKIVLKRSCDIAWIAERNTVFAFMHADMHTLGDIVFKSILK